MRMPPSVPLRVRTSTAVACVWPSVLLYLKLLVRVGFVFGVAPELDWQPHNNVPATMAAMSIFIRILPSPQCPPRESRESVPASMRSGAFAARQGAAGDAQPVGER